MKKGIFMLFFPLDIWLHFKKKEQNYLPMFAFDLKQSKQASSGSAPWDVHAFNKQR